MSTCSHTYDDGRKCPRDAVHDSGCEYHNPANTIIRFTRHAQKIGLSIDPSGTPVFIADDGGHAEGTVWAFPNDEAAFYMADGSAVVATEEEFEQFRENLLAGLKETVAIFAQPIHAAIAARDVDTFWPYLKTTKGRKKIQKLLADPDFTPDERDFLTYLLNLTIP